MIAAQRRGDFQEVISAEFCGEQAPVICRAMTQAGLL